jgi:hypothetical protein
VNIFGVNSTSTTYTETKGVVDGKCVLYKKILKNSVAYTDSLKAQLAKSGMAADNIAATETKANAQAAAMESRDSTCHYPLAGFDTMISGWSKGTFSASSDDWAKYECTGTMNNPIPTG